MSIPSPRKVGIGMMQNFMALDSPDSDARSSRIALKDELVGKLVFDDPQTLGFGPRLSSIRCQLCTGIQNGSGLA